MKIDSFKVEEWFNKYEKLAKYNLADVCIDSMSINELLDLSNGNLSSIFNKQLGYGDIQGSSRLKQAILSLYKNQAEENITVTHGAIGANQLVYLSLIEKGDEVVSILPAYQQHYSIPESLGADVKYLFLQPEDSWLPNIEKLEALVSKKTKLIVLTNPNNPTGSVIKDKMMKNIISIARKNDCYILVDEVYRGIVINDDYATTSISDLYEKGIATSSVSKSFSLAGLRVGWIVANKTLIKEINHHREYNTISVSILDDYFASIAIENKDKIFYRNRSKQSIGYSILSDWVANEINVSCILPKGATSAFVQYDLDLSSYKLCKDLLSDTGVLFLPGETFEYDKFLRVGYCNNHEMLQKALNIFSEWLQNKSTKTY